MKHEPYPIIGKILLIPVEQIQTTDDPFLPLMEQEIERLAELIRANGLLHPILVSRISQNQFSVVSSELIFHAAVTSGMTDVSCILIEADEQYQIFWQIINDRQNGSLHYLQMARRIRLLSDQYHLTLPELASELGISLKDVTDLLKLCELSDETQKMIIKEDISQDAALLLVNQPEEERKELLDLIIDRHLPLEKIMEEIKVRNSRYSKKGKIIVFKDTTVFTNTIDRAVTAMSEAGINTICQKAETEQQIEYHITIQTKTSEKTSHLSTG